jgi:ribosome-associated heat shock protein Hsp15
MSEASCRVDVWLWRARFFKTRSLAARMVEEGRVRLLRGDQHTRVDKPSRCVRAGDGLIFAFNGRLTAVRVEQVGERRGPASEAQRLYAALDDPAPPPGIDT